MSHDIVLKISNEQKNLLVFSKYVQGYLPRNLVYDRNQVDNKKCVGSRCRVSMYSLECCLLLALPSLDY